MTPDLARNIPKELRDRAQWVCWRTEYRLDAKGQPRPTKVPYQALTGEKAASDKPATWCSFEEALAAAAAYDGIGYMFAADDPYFGADLDGCRNPASGDIEPWAQSLLSWFPTFAEVSPSQTGVKIFGRGSLPPDAWHRRELKGVAGYESVAGYGGHEPAVECYSEGRFFAVTGARLDEAPLELRDCSAALVELQERFARKKPAANNGAQPAASETDSSNGSVPAWVTDADIEHKVRYDPKYEALWQGRWQDYYGSQSSADLSLCGRIAYFAGRDPSRIDRIFRRSELAARDKWDSPKHGSRGSTYGADTVAEALAGKTKFYVWKKDEDEDTEEEGSAGGPAPALVSDVPAAPEEINATDMGNASRLARRHGHSLRYSKSHGWLIYDGRRWRPDEKQVILEFAKDTVRSIYAEAALPAARDARRELADWAKQSESVARIMGMVRLAQSIRGIPVATSELDADPWLLNCRNGTVDLRTGERREHRRDDLITRLAPVSYDPNASCPRWLKFLSEIMGGNTGLVDYLQRWAGYSLTGDVSEQSLLFLHGMGANGKSTFLRVLQAVMGDYASQAAPGLLLDRKGDRHPTEIADLLGRRLVASVEVGEGKRLAEELLKHLTGGDRLKGRYMRQDFFEFDPSFKLMLAANHKPIVKGTDHAIWRRIPLVPFDVTFTDTGEPRKDPLLFDKLMGELPGILAWCVRGALEWRKHRLSAPEEVRRATAAYRAEMDTLGDFLADCCVQGEPEQFRATAADLYKAYEQWCDAGGEKPISKKAFGMRLKERGFTSDSDGYTRQWLGVGLLVPPTDHDASGPMTHSDAFFGMSKADARERVVIRKNASDASWGQNASWEGGEDEEGRPPAEVRV